MFLPNQDVGYIQITVAVALRHYTLRATIRATLLHAAATVYMLCLVPA